MTKKNPHWGTTFDTFLSEEGMGCMAKRGQRRRAENSYQFADPETLLADFWNDVEAWRR